MSRAPRRRAAIVRRRRLTATLAVLTGATALAGFRVVDSDARSPTPVSDAVSSRHLPTPDPATPGVTPGSAASRRTGTATAMLAAMHAPHGRGHLMAGSQPSALPGPILIADRANNRLLVVDPEGRVRWQFPQPGDLKPGQHF